MLAAISRTWRRKKRERKQARQRQVYLREDGQAHEGFHGDRYLMDLANVFLSRADAFIETGTFAGTTAEYVHHRYSLPVFTCDADPMAFDVASRRLAECPGVEVVNQASPAFLHDLFARMPELRDKTVCWWLDAHGEGFQWPLCDEVKFVTENVESAFLMIDDFLVPGQPQFGYDEYDGQVCSWDYIRDSLASRVYSHITPAYQERTSDRHGLRGVGVLVFGTDQWVLPPQVAQHFRVEQLSV